MWPSHARRQGVPAREAATGASDVTQANALYLQQHPAHILVVVQAQRAVFTRGDIEAGFRDRLYADGDRACGIGGRGNGLGRGGASGAEQPRWPGAIRHHGAGLRSAAPGNPGARHGDRRPGRGLRAGRARHRSVGRQRPDAGSAGGRASDAVADAADAGKRLCGNRQDLHAGRGGAGLAGARLRGSGRRSLGQGDAGAWRHQGHADRVTGGLAGALVAG